MTVFQKIIDGKLPCQKVFENERILAFKDIAPIAPVHILIIPKKAYASLQEVPEADLGIIAEIAGVAQKLAKEFHLEDGYRLLTNCGPLSGQLVLHLHYHLIGGRKLGPFA